MMVCIVKDTGPPRINTVGGLFHSCHDKTDFEMLRIGEIKATRRMSDPSITWTITGQAQTPPLKLQAVTTGSMVELLRSLHAEITV